MRVACLGIEGPGQGDEQMICCCCAAGRRGIVAGYAGWLHVCKRNMYRNGGQVQLNGTAGKTGGKTRAQKT